MSQRKPDIATSFSQRPEPSLLTRAAFAVGGLTATGAIAYGSYKSGLTDELLGLSYAPQPDHQDEIVTGINAIHEALRTTGPYVLGGAIAVDALHALYSRYSSRAQLTRELSGGEIDGVQQLSVDDTGRRPLTPERLRRYSRGLGLAAVTATVVSATSGTERAIVEGSLRPITTLEQLLAPSAGGQEAIITEASTTTFMSSSTLPAREIRMLAQLTEYRGWQITPFSKSLKEIDGETGIEVSIPDERFTAFTGEAPDPGCREVHAIVDTTVGRGKGERATINDSTSVEVAAVMPEVAQMSRRIAVLSQSDFDACLNHGTEAAYFGALVEGASPEQVNQVLQSEHLVGQSKTFQQFLENNRDFWRLNASAVLGLMIASIGLFGSWAVINERKHVLQRTTSQLGSLMASGVKAGALAPSELLRTVRESSRATALAVLPMTGFVAVLNAAVSGLQAGIGLREVGVGFTVTLASKLAGGMSTLRKIRHINIQQAVRGK